MAVTVGSIHVDVVPSTENFITRMKREILGEADKLGRELGERIGRQVADAAASEVAEGIEDGVNDADTEAAAGKKGRSAGGRFAREFKASISAALQDLPEVDIEVDDSELTAAQLQLKALRKGLDDLRRKTVGVNLDADTAFGELVAFRAALEALRDGNIDVDFDVDSAIANLGKLQESVARDFGGNFDNTLRTSITNALSNLPRIDVDADIDPAQRTLGALRNELRALSDSVNIDLDIDADAASAEVARLIAELELLVNDQTVNVKVRADAAAAIASLGAIGALTDKLKGDFAELDREAGSFARTLRTQVETLLRNIPDIEIDANTNPARRALADVRSEFEALRDIEIGVDVSTADAIAGLLRLEAVLEGLVNSADVDVRFNSRAALADAQAFRATLEAALDDVQVGVQVEPRDPGAFARNLREELARLQATLPDIEVDFTADGSPALNEVARIRAAIGNLSANIDIDTDIPAVLAELAVLQGRLAAIDNDAIRINVVEDINTVIAKLAALRGATAAAGEAADGAATRTARWRLILAAVVVLLPLIAAAVVALAAALALVVTPILAVAAGLDGIKKAVEPLRDDLVALKTEVSAAFEQGLATAVLRAADAFPVFSAGLADTAGVLSEVTTEIVNVITSSENLRVIGQNFDLINGVIRSLAPSLGSLAQNFTDFVTIGGQGLSTFGVEMTQVGDTWARVIARLSGDSGTGQAAVRAFFQVLAELLNLTGSLTEFGAVMAATFGPALAAALSVLSAGFEAFAAVLDFLPGPMQTVVTAAILISTTLLVLGRSGAGIVLAFANLFTASVTAAGGLAIFGAATRTLLAVLGGPLGAILLGVVTVLSFVGQGQSAAAEATAAHEAAAQSLGDALERTNGVITQSIRDQTNKTLIDAGATEAATSLGLSTREITEAIVEQGPAYDALIGKLEGYVASGVNASSVTSEFGDELYNSAQGSVVQGEAAQRLLDIVRPLGDEFRLTAENIRLYQEATGAAVTTAAVGVANAASLSAAIGVLGEESSTTSAKVKALGDALDALNGGQLTAEEAASQLRGEIEGIGKAFEEAAKATSDAGVSLIMANGAIDNTTEAGRALLTATLGIRDGMIESATAAFDAAGGLGNVEAASAAAAGEVQVARDAFVAAAREAGLSADAAQDLANRYGLIPSLVTTLLRAENLPVVNQDLITLQQRLSGVAAGATVNVGILADETLTVLDQIGIKVTTGLDGTATITVDDQTVPGIESILGFIANSEGQLPVLGNTAPAALAAQQERARIEAVSANLPVDLNRDGVGAALNAVQQDALNTVVQIPLDATDDLARSKFTELLAAIDGSVGLVVIDGVAEPASAALSAIVAAINAGRGTVNIDGNDVPVAEALQIALDRIDSSSAVVEIGGENFPASQVLDETLAAIAAGSESVTIGGEDFPAQGVLSALLGDVVASSAAIKVLADAAAANAAIDNAARNRTAIITVVTNGANARNVSNPNLTGNSGQASGNFLVPMARGGILDTFNGQQLTPMAARAAKIKPNTWRVIGDNMKVPEVYAPLDGSARSLSFLRAGVQAYGLDVAPMAIGGLIDSALRLTDQFNPRASAPAQQARPINGSGALATRADALADLTTDRVETKLDEIAELLRSSRGGPSAITVNDQSGNPVETARAMQLALRLAR